MNVLKASTLPLRKRLRIIASMFMINSSSRSRRRRYEESRRKPKNYHRNRGYALEEFDRLPDAIFLKMFRIDRETFLLLEQNLDRVLKKNEMKAKASSGSVISTRTRLAVTLRWLAGGIYLDLCFAWGISKTSFFSERGVLWPTIAAIDDAFALGFPLSDKYALDQLAAGFEVHSGGVLKGCVMAIDGLAVRTRQPFKSEVSNVKAWRCRKGGFAMVVMAGCDVNGRFHMATANHSGSTNDIIVWENSQLAREIESEKLADEYFIIGDEAFTCTQQVLSPWPGRGIGLWKDSFNYWLSHSRQVIERAFGMLTMRWGIFWRKFTFAYERWSLVTMVCMKLHNLCIDRNCKFPQHRASEDQAPGDSWVVYDNNDPFEDPQLRARGRGDRRGDITDKLMRDGLGRPVHAQPNARA